MLLNAKSIFVTVFVVCAVLSYEKVPYFVFERAVVIDHEPEFLTYVNISARRYSRKDPVYYFNVHFNLNDTINSKYGFFFDFYEYLSNAYKPSFVQFQGRVCTMLNHPVLGAMIRPAFLQNLKKPRENCPFPKGIYHLQNMTLRAVRNFPFRKGRVFGNITYIPTNISIFYGSVDFEIKEMTIK